MWAALQEGFNQSGNTLLLLRWGVIRWLTISLVLLGATTTLAIDLTGRAFFSIDGGTLKFLIPDEQHAKVRLREIDTLEFAQS